LKKLAILESMGAITGSTVDVFVVGLPDDFLAVLIAFLEVRETFDHLLSLQMIFP